MPNKTLHLKITKSLCLIGTDFDLFLTVNLTNKSASISLPPLESTAELTMVTVKFGYDAEPNVKVVVHCRAMDQIDCCSAYIIRHPGDYLQVMKIKGTWVRLK